VEAATIATSVLGGIGGLSGVGALATALFKRRTVKADAAETVTDTALELMAELKADAKATRTELATVRAEAESLASRLRTLIAAIHDPVMTLERLRGMVPMGGVNGSGHR
jgi:hypothetical protein